MSWITLTPPKPSAGTQAKITVTLTAQFSKNRRPSLCLLLRAHLLDLPWLKPGVLATVEWGTAEHHGKLRVAPGGPFRIGRAGGKIERRRVLVVYLAAPEHITSAPPPSPCASERAPDGSLIVTLPPWACEPKPKRQPLAMRVPDRTAAPVRIREGYESAANVAWADAMRWAEDNGIDTINGDDDEVLERANDARVAANLPPFQIVQTKHMRLPRAKEGIAA